MSLQDNSCCCDIRYPTPSPFEILPFDFYDGVTSGLALCTKCGATYTFDTLSSSEERLRFYGFARIALNHFNAMSEAFASAPTSLEQLPDWRIAVALVEARVPANSQERNVLVLANNLEEEILRSRTIQFPAWMSLFELITL